MTSPTHDVEPQVAPESAAGATVLADASSQETRPHVTPSEGFWGLAFYLFVEPLSVGRVVVDLSSSGGPGAEILRRAGAVEVLCPPEHGLPLALPSGGADVLIRGLSGAEVSDERARGALFAEIRRVLKGEGLCIIRVMAETLENAAVGVSLRAALADLMLEHFATVDIVEETPFRAVSYFVPGCDDLAVSEAVSRVGGKPSHLVALCTPAANRTWHLGESLLVPIGPGDSAQAGEGELAAWRAEVERLTAESREVTSDRDQLRESEMAVQDRAERLTRTVAGLRKDIERFLRQISDDAAARELLMLERDQLRRKLAAAESEVEAARREADKQKTSVQALRKEVARLRAARGATGTDRGTP